MAVSFTVGLSRRVNGLGEDNDRLSRPTCGETPRAVPKHPERKVYFELYFFASGFCAFVGRSEARTSGVDRKSENADI
jgi:hypothetical protein